MPSRQTDLVSRWSRDSSLACSCWADGRLDKDSGFASCSYSGRLCVNSSPLVDEVDCISSIASTPFPVCLVVLYSVSAFRLLFVFPVVLMMSAACVASFGSISLAAARLAQHLETIVFGNVTHISIEDSEVYNVHRQLEDRNNMCNASHHVKILRKRQCGFFSWLRTVQTSAASFVPNFKKN